MRKMDRRFRRRIVKGNFSAARMGRIMPIVERIQKESEVIFNTAEKIMKIENPARVRLIFVGQGMRPLFEAARAINEIEGTFPRRNVRYFVNPSILRFSPEGTRLLVDTIKKVFEKRRVVSKGIDTYFVFDRSSQGVTHDRIRAAILAAKPNAKIFRVDNNSKEFGLGIMAADGFSKPTRKIHQGTLMPRILPTDQSSRDEFLAFEWLLSNYLKKRKPR